MITRTTCRVCEGALDPILSLGEHYVSDFIEPGASDGIKAPLELVLCRRCRLLQLKHTVPGDAMYRNYWYRSGTNQTMRTALADIANKAEKLAHLKADDAVLDIGCNDGTLLASYKAGGIFKNKGRLVIWLTDDDIELLARANTTVVHNPISNLKLGSGLLRLDALRRAGVPLCLGSDGSSSNDTFNMFEVLKCTALIHKIASPDCRTWPSARDILHMTLRGGARSTMLQGQVGVLIPGALADVVLLRLDTPAFMPLHDPANHLVYCESGRDVDTVIVGGRVVVEGGRVTTVDAGAIYDEIATLKAELSAMQQRLEQLSRR